MLFLQLTTDVPCTFVSLESYILKTGVQAGGTVRAKFQFRTHDEDGLLMYHQMNDQSEVRVSRKYFLLQYHSVLLVSCEKMLTQSENRYCIKSKCT